MKPKPFEHHFRIALHDTDAAGVLFFAHLFRHAHDAYEAWMAKLGFPLDAMIRDGDLALPLVHAEADYRRPMRHADQVGVMLVLSELGDGSFTIDYRFDVDDGKLAANARTVHVCVQPGTAGACALPEALSVALRPWLQPEVLWID